MFSAPSLFVGIPALVGVATLTARVTMVARRGASDAALI